MHPFALKTVATRGRRAVLAVVGSGAALVAALAGGACAQELEPRAYSPAPVGTNFLLLGAVHQSGEVLPDPTLPVTDVHASATSAVFAYSRSFGLAGHAASLALALPYVSLDAEGNVGGNSRERSVNGLGDLRLRLAVGLLGSPALTPQEFAQRTPEPLLGASVSIVAPTGDYDSSRLVNIGAHRWAFKPEVGMSLPIGKVFAEVSSGVWLFTDNDDFLGGQRRQQDPLWSLQFHLGYNFAPGFWAAANATYFTGGRTSLNGMDKQDLQSNSRYGGTLAYPLGRQLSLKASYSRGLITRAGGDFDTVSVFLQYRWFDGPKSAPAEDNAR
jgi:hypothetical protein